MSIHKDSKQVRISLPEFLVEIFNINPNEDKFNWYVKRNAGRVRLTAVLVKKGNIKDVHIGQDKEKYFEKEMASYKLHKTQWNTIHHQIMKK